MSETVAGEGYASLYRRCRHVLEHEGFVVRRGTAGPSLPDLIASNRAHTLHVLVVPDPEIDAERTRSRIAASVRRAETRVFVTLPFRWRMISNLERWGIDGVAVDML